MDNNLHRLREWYQTSLGTALLHAEKVGFDQALPLLFGYYLLQLNIPDAPELLAASTIHTRIKLGPEIPSNPPNNFIQSNFNELPFLPNSIDVTIILHLLEYAPDPQKILQEVYNILIPGGTMLMFCFNPHSLWGLARWFKKNRQAPWNGKFISPLKMRRLLQNAGFSVGDYKTFYFRPPLEQDSAKKWLFLETLGQIFFPYCGGSYMYIAKKTVAGMTLIKPEMYKNKLATANSLIKPTTRISE